MCGILGTIPSSEPHHFKMALDTLTHRGPDSSGVEHLDGEISLGHRRLAILDLSENGRQPMFSEDERYSLIFNGEIYNFLELKSTLSKLGHKFKSISDSEVLLSAFIEWGPDCVLKFNGMWAIAIWDRKKKELFLSRDRFGKKPLFYAFIGDKFVFASEMKAIMPFMDRVEVSDDFHWMKENIFHYETTEKCLIKGIKRFPLGHNGTFKNGKLNISRYWNTLDHLIEAPGKYEEQVELFRELFMDSCKLRMRSDVSIGTALSGGLDSSATIAAMAHLSKDNRNYAKDWQHAFVATFPGTPLDESYYAKKVTDHLGLKATFIDIKPLEHWDRIEEYFYLFEDLYITSPIPMIMTYHEVKKNGVTVTLDGHGADELMSGYNHFIEALWDSKFSYRKSRDIMNTYLDTMSDDAQFEKPNGTKMAAEYLIKKAVKKVIRSEKVSRDQDHRNFRKLDNFTRHLYGVFHETILPTLLRNYDRYAMINSVEIRMPFMDHRLVSLVNSLPYSSKMGGGYTKKLIRDAIDPYLPKEVTWRKSKIGFNSPTVDWMQNDLSEWFMDTVHNADFLGSDLVEDPQKLQQEVVEIVKGNNNSFIDAQHCWKEMTPYLWEKAVLKKQYHPA